jgi:hypothetical protein
VESLRELPSDTDCISPMPQNEQKNEESKENRARIRAGHNSYNFKTRVPILKNQIQTMKNRTDCGPEGEPGL